MLRKCTFSNAPNRCQFFHFFVHDTFVFFHESQWTTPSEPFLKNYSPIDSAALQASGMPAFVPGEPFVVPGRDGRLLMLDQLGENFVEMPFTAKGIAFASPTGSVHGNFVKGNHRDSLLAVGAHGTVRSSTGQVCHPCTV